MGGFAGLWTTEIKGEERMKNTMTRMPSLLSRAFQPLLLLYADVV